MVRAVPSLASAASVASAATAAVPTPAPPAGPGFDDTLVSAIGQVEVQHTQADDFLQRLAAGEQVDLHGTMIELEKADIALRTMVSVRDRFISAYEQVMNMTV